MQKPHNHLPPNLSIWRLPDHGFAQNQDSLLLSIQRNSRSQFELLAENKRDAENRTVALSKSWTGKIQMEIILQTFSDILDFSSISNESFLHEAIVECSNLSRAGTVIILKALNLLTRNGIYLFKLEGKLKTRSGRACQKIKHY